MSRLTFRLRFTALVLAAALTVPGAATAATAAQHQPSGSGLLQHLWVVFAGLWSTGVDPDSACKWDPDGRCLPGGATLAPAIVPDSGCMMDPSGGCVTGS